MAGSQIFNTVIEFFESDNWNFHWLDGMSVLSVPFTGKNGRWMCYAQAREEQEQFVYYSVCPVNVPKERLAVVAEFVTRANYGMIIGNFELDYSDGEVRYKTSIDVEGDDLSAALVRQLVYANVIVMDRYLPGLMAVIYGEANPTAEIEKIEGSRKGILPTKLEDSATQPGDHLSDQIRSRIEDILRRVEDAHDYDDHDEFFGEDDDDDDLFGDDDDDDDLLSDSDDDTAL